MNHILLHKKRIDGRNFNPKNLEGRREGSHEALIGYFTKDLDELGADWESFYERIYDLKTFRTDCDYKDVAVMPQHSQKAFELSGQILDQLFEYYDL